MAQLPLDEQTILGLQKSGKISAATAEMARSKLPADYAPTLPKEQVDRVFANPGNFFESGTEDYKKARDFYAENPTYDPKAYKPQLSLEEVQKRDAAGVWTPALAKDREFYQGTGQLAKPEGKGPSPASASPEKVDVSELAIQPKKPAQAAGMPDLGLGELDKAYSLQAAGAKGIADAQAQGYEQQASLLEEQNRKAAEFDKKRKELQERRNADGDKRLQEIEQISQQVNKETEINPNRYWQNMTTGNKIAASIGIALGAIGAAMQGSGENQALKIINNAIERDIEAQRNAAQNARNKLGDAITLYQMMLNKYGDEETALMASKALALGQVENKIKAMQARTQGQTAKANGNILLGKVKEEQSKTGAAIKIHAAKTVAARQASMGEGVEDPSLLPEDQQKRVVKLPNGLYKPAVSVEAAGKVQEIQLAGKNVSDILRKMEQVRGAALPYSEAREIGDQLKNDLRTQLLKMKGLGVPTGKDVEMVDALGVDPTSWRQDIVAAKLKGLHSNVQSSVDNALSVYVPGYSPIQRK